MGKTLIKRLPGRSRTWSEAQAICNRMNKTSRKYAYVVESNRPEPGYHVIGIPKERIK